MQASTEFLDCRTLPTGSLVDVETKSRHYRIEYLGESRIRISGHPQYCPTPVIATLQGSLNPTGGLESGFIERGQRLVLLFGDGMPITTSRVLHVSVDPQRTASSLS